MIGINARYRSREQPTGMQRAAETLVRALSLSWADEVRLFTAPEGASRAAAQVWEQTVLPQQARRAGCRALLNPIQTAPVLHAGVKQVVVVHDLHFVHHPQWFGRGFRAWNRLVTLRAIRRADYVIAISDHVLADVRATCGVSARRSSRVYDIGPEWVGGAEPPGRPTLLCVNAFQPHKNLARVLSAVDRLSFEFPDLEVRIAGRRQENFAPMDDVLTRLDRPGVRVLGYLTDEQLQAEYRRCTALCFPSLSEGFGLPVLEAAAVGTPAIVGRAGALPEVAGDGAVFVDPRSVESIAGGIREVITMAPAARAALVAAGRANLARFSAAAAVRAYGRLFATLQAAAPEQLPPLPGHALAP